MRLYTAFFKRIMDVFLSCTALICLSPLLLAVAILVRITFGRPVIFRQDRPGKNEKIFKLYKFRTMTRECDAGGNLLPDCERLTKLGIFLRQTSLDELPELWNIVKGDMSIVGPRPLLTSYLPYYTEEEKHRHDVRPGLSGMAQINGRNHLDWDTRLRKDIEYVENITFAGDVNIIFRTLLKAIVRENVEADTDTVEGNLAEIRQTALCNVTIDESDPPK